MEIYRKLCCAILVPIEELVSIHSSVLLTAGNIGVQWICGTNRKTINFPKQGRDFINNRNISKSSPEVIIHYICILHSKADISTLVCSTSFRGFEVTVLHSRSTFHTKLGKAHLCENQLPWRNWRFGLEWFQEISSVCHYKTPLLCWPSTSVSQLEYETRWEDSM